MGTCTHILLYTYMYVMYKIVKYDEVHLPKLRNLQYMYLWNTCTAKVHMMNHTSYT